LNPNTHTLKIEFLYVIYVTTLLERINKHYHPINADVKKGITQISKFVILK